MNKKTPILPGVAERQGPGNRQHENRDCHRCLGTPGQWCCNDTENNIGNPDRTGQYRSGIPAERLQIHSVPHLPGNQAGFEPEEKPGNILVGLRAGSDSHRN